VLCDECATVVPGERRILVAQCNACGALLEPFTGTEVQRAAAVGVATPLWRRLDDIFAYVTRTSVLLSMAGLAVATVLLGLVASFTPFLGLLVALFAFGLEAALFFRIIETSAYGRDDLEPPDVSTAGEAIFGPALWYVAAVLPAAVPTLLIGVQAFEMALAGAAPWQLFDDFALPALLWLGGFLMMPLLLAIAALGRSVSAIYNPLHWFDSLRQLKWDYAVGAGLFYALYLAELIAGVLMGLVTSVIHIPIASAVATAFVVFAVRALRFRTLGLMCEPHMERGVDGLP